MVKSQTMRSPSNVASPAIAAATATGVELRGISKHYGSVTAVNKLFLEIPAGSYCCLLGPSGCGKTTTLRMIAGHESLSQGEILIGGQVVNQIPPTKRNTAMVFQNYALFPHKTVQQNVEFGLKMRGVDRQATQQRTREILEVVGLEALGDRKPAMLSGGQQQRVALARALVTLPQVLLLDEPLSALDESLRVKTRGELRRLQQQFGLTFIQVTHAQDEAFSLSDQIVVMDHGHIEQVGTPQAIFDRPATRFVAQFVGDNNLFTGTVTAVHPSQHPELGQRVELQIADLGRVYCLGKHAQVGLQATCAVRADALQVLPTSKASESTHGSTSLLQARIVAIEFTGYLTRVSLVLESGQEVLFKARTTDWLAQPFVVDTTVAIAWQPENGIFLSS
ncbi:MAG: ABC transporter ATP-binding protein [Cyanobacteria bacterium P01_H01_bin.121]